MVGEVEHEPAWGQNGRKKMVVVSVAGKGASSWSKVNVDKTESEWH